jgi:hypothetical protein
MVWNSSGTMIVRVLAKTFDPVKETDEKIKAKRINNIEERLHNVPILLIFFK